MRRFFVKNLLFVIAVNVLVKPLWVFLIDRGVQNRVGTAAYGTYQALLSLSIIFQTVLDFGISNYNSRTIAQNPDKLKDVFPAMLSARLVLIVIYIGLGYTWGWIFGYRGWELTLLIGILLIQSLNALMLFIRSNVAALHKFRIDGALSVTDRLLMLIICGFLLFYPATAHLFKIQWFVAAQIFCYFVAGIIGYIILRHIAKVHLRFSFHVPTVITIMKASFPYALLIFLMSIYNRSDAMMIERLCADGKNQAGIWAAAYRLLDMSNMFGLMFAAVLLPLFGRMLAKGQDVAPIVKVSVNMLLPMSFSVSVACMVFGTDIMHVLYKLGDDPAYYGLVFGCVMASFPAFCIMYVYSTLLTANGSLKALNFIALAGVVINLSLNFHLIPHYRALGGAVTAFITQTSLAICFIIFCVRIIRLPVNMKWLFAHLGYLALVVALAFGIQRLLHTGWLPQAAIFAVICLVMMFAFRFVSVSGIRQLAAKES